MDIGLKDAIAQEAIKYVETGDVIAIGGGTTAYVFASICSNRSSPAASPSSPIRFPWPNWSRPLESKDVEVIVTGGVITRSNSLVGPIADKVVSLAACQHRIPRHPLGVDSPWLPDAEFAGSRNRYSDDGHRRSLP